MSLKTEHLNQLGRRLAAIDATRDALERLKNAGFDPADFGLYDYDDDGESVSDRIREEHEELRAELIRRVALIFVAVGGGCESTLEGPTAGAIGTILALSSVDVPATSRAQDMVDAAVKSGRLAAEVQKLRDPLAPPAECRHENVGVIASPGQPNVTRCVSCRVDLVLLGGRYVLAGERVLLEEVELRMLVNALARVPGSTPSIDALGVRLAQHLGQLQHRKVLAEAPAPAPSLHPAENYAAPVQLTADQVKAAADAGIDVKSVIEEANRQAARSSACKRAPWCVRQVGHAGGCSPSMLPDGSVIS